MILAKTLRDDSLLSEEDDFVPEFERGEHILERTADG